MAINFLNKVDYNQNELDHARIVNEAGNVAAGTGVKGQLYFDTTADGGIGVLKVWTSSWVEVGGGVESLTSGDGTASTGEAITINTAAIGAVTLDAFAYAGGSNVGYVPLGGTSSTVLQGDGTWTTNVNTTYSIDVPTGTTSINLKGATPVTNDAIAFASTGLITLTRTDASTITIGSSADAYTSWTLAGDSGSTAIASGDTATVAGNSVTGKEGIDTVESAGTVNINLDLAEINTSATVAVADSLILDRAADSKNIRTRVDDIHLNQFGAPEANMLGGGFQYKNLADGTAQTVAVNLQPLEAAVTGLFEFKGGFNASTGALDAPLSGNLTSGGSRIAVEVGDYYVVTTAGDFFGNSATPVTAGDSVICQTDAAVGTSVEADFIVVDSESGVVDFTNNNPAGTFVAYGTVNTNARGSVTIAGVDLTASGTKDSTTFLRGDNVFALPPVISVVHDTTADQLGIKVVTASNIATVGFNYGSLTDIGTPVAADTLPIYDDSAVENKKVTIANLATAVSGNTSKRLLLNTTTTDVSQQLSPPAGTIGWVIAGAAVGASSALDMTMELVRVSDGTTAFAQVTRSGSNMTINFVNTPVVAQGDYTALVTRIG